MDDVQVVAGGPPAPLVGSDRHLHRVQQFLLRDVGAERGERDAAEPVQQ